MAMQPRRGKAWSCGGWPHSLAACAATARGCQQEAVGIVPQIKNTKDKSPWHFLVGVAGLEPTASWTRTRHATNCATPRYQRIKIIWSMKGKVKYFSLFFLFFL